MLKRDGRVYTQIVKNCSANELMPILKEFSKLDSSTIYSDCWKAYDGLVDYGAKAHYRVKHSKNEFQFATLQDTNGKIISTVQKTFSQRECVLSVASKTWLSTRAAT